ncbi:MAG: EpsI family protein [Bryobacteraceae bacterium]|nr:EpsI family protein [Bryobacteraceae bacterium]
MQFPRSRAVLLVTVLLLAQAALLYSSVRKEVIPAGKPLKGFPTSLDGWRMLQEGVIEKEIQDVLQADDLLNRTYGNGSSIASLFVAAFQSQRNGKTPHSPKNCLPGSGWVPLVSEERQVETPIGTLNVNHYQVGKGDSRSVVLYWYQSRDRSVASEYTAKLYVIADAIRYNRTDTALVRVVVPAEKGREDEAVQVGESLIRAAYPRIREFLPR